MKSLIFFLLLVPSVCRAQTTLPTIRTDQDSIRMYADAERANFNGINSLSGSFPHSFEVPVVGIQFAFVSAKDSVHFLLKKGDTFRLKLIRESKRDTVLCTFSGIVKAATFSDAYVKEHKGRNFVEVPEVYELMNVLIALTPTGLNNPDLLPEKTPYYAQMLSYFGPFRKHPAVVKVDSLLDRGKYNDVKMDSYAYLLQNDKLVKGPIYDRVSWGSTNSLDAYVPIFNDFVKKSTFKRFYQQHLPYYRSLMADYRTNVNIDKMTVWLEKQFPRTNYSSVKAIFSPLVAGNQSENNFEDNGFREVQMHINFPYTDDKNGLDRIKQARRQEIAFTELNHAYINPEADQYGKEINTVFSTLDKWMTEKRMMSYPDPYSCFCEYMNWALVTLYHSDRFTGKEFDALRDGVDRRMVDRRGFVKFKEFDAELLRLYKSRKPGQTVADLYPAILTWCAKQ